MREVCIIAKTFFVGRSMGERGENDLLRGEGGGRRNGLIVALSSIMKQLRIFGTLARHTTYIANFPTSFCIVSLILTLLECGSVHTKPASTR